MLRIVEVFGRDRIKDNPLYFFDVFPGVAVPTETGQITCVHALQFLGDIPVL